MSIDLKQITAIVQSRNTSNTIKADQLSDLLDQYEPFDNPEEKELERQFLLGNITLDDYLLHITKK